MGCGEPGGTPGVVGATSVPMPAPVAPGNCPVGMDAEGGQDGPGSGIPEFAGQCIGEGAGTEWLAIGMPQRRQVDDLRRTGHSSAPAGTVAPSPRAVSKSPAMTFP